MIYTILEWGCTIIALAAFLYRLVTIPGSRFEPAITALCVYFFGSFFSFFVGLDLISPYVARVFGYHNVTIILSHGAVIILTAAQLVVLTYWAYPAEVARRRARQTIYAFAAVLAVLVTVFLVSLPMERHGTSETSSLLNLHNGTYAAYLVAVTTVIALGQVITVRVSWGFSRVTASPWLRRSMWMVAAGAVLILVYSAMRITEVVCVQLGVDIAAWDPVQWLAGDVGSLLELLGWTAPGWGPSLTTAARWLGNYRRYHQLRPLWTALHRATPDIALAQPPAPLGELRLMDLNYRLYRRVIEILDGQRALRPYIDLRVYDAIRRSALTGGTGSVEPLTEALCLHAGLRAKARGYPVLTDPAVPVAVFHPEDLAGETARLAAVAREFRRSRGLAESLPIEQAHPAQ
ncbi:MAG TPA: MAB_1171c family putative transporter [Rugosimonospora sp.]|nr:MAB_1171c family putative transporter [Rugosimonospora sp.]